MRVNAIQKRAHVEVGVEHNVVSYKAEKTKYTITVMSGLLSFFPLCTFLASVLASVPGLPRYVRVLICGGGDNGEGLG